jgi:hypothetical protein
MLDPMTSLTVKTGNKTRTVTLDRLCDVLMPRRSDSIETLNAKLRAARRTIEQNPNARRAVSISIESIYEEIERR